MSNDKLKECIYEAIIDDCDGFFCGKNIIKGSIPADRLDRDSFWEFLKEILEDYDFREWFLHWLEELLKELFEKWVNEEWFKELLCNLDCGDSIFEVEPQNLIFGPEGGTQTFRITVGADESWTAI